MNECVQGDARAAETYGRALRGEKAALLLTDPPYCLLVRRRKSGDLRDKRQGVKIDRDPVIRFEDVRAYRKFTGEWLPRAVDCLSPGAPLLIWTNFLGKEPIVSAARALGYGVLAFEFIWAKGEARLTGSEHLLRVYEVALVLLRAPLPPLAPGEWPRTGSVVAGYDDEGEADRWGAHPNHKPFPVLEPLVRAWSRPGELVLDPFAGSGSIPAAALRLGRRAACSEIDPAFAATVTRRLSIPVG